jgi:hypothetical protein
LNKEKYAALDSDEMMKGIKEMSENGMPMTNITIYNLPSPAKNVTGKNITLSDDKMKVTIKSSSEDFFDSGKDFEFRIEY